MDDKLQIGFVQSSLGQMKKVQDAVTKRTNLPESSATEKSKEVIREKASAAKEKAKEITKESKERVKEVAETVKTKTSKAASAAVQTAKDAVVQAKPTPKADSSSTRPATFSEGLEGLVKEVEAALAGKPTDSLPEALTASERPDGSSADVAASRENDAPETGLGAIDLSSDSKTYLGELPIGFEPPPGYSRAKAPSSPAPSASSSTPKKDADEIPLLAPTVAELASSEPAIAELASTIDSLTAFIKSTPGAAGSKTAEIISSARDDLKQLAGRIEGVREEERTKLEEKMDKQAQEYSMKLLETELSAQDKLDEQEMEFRRFFEDERRNMIQAYRSKLEAELKRQSEIINDR